jgi:two-component system NtrC family sensor kinase
MTSKLTAVAGFLFLALLIWAGMFAFDSFFPHAGPWGHVWHSAAAALPASAAFWFLARRELHRRQAAEEESRLKADLLDSAGDSIFLHDADGNLVYVNEAACRAHGYSREELIGLNLQDLAAPEYGRLAGPRMKRVLETRGATFQSAHRLRGGAVMPVEVHARRINSGGKNLILSVVRDISERKQAEKALSESQEKYRSIFEAAANLIASVTPDGTIIDCNGRAESMLGYGREELIGQSMARVLHPDYAEAARQALEETLAKGFAYDKGCRCVRKDGSIIDVSMNLSALPGDGGKRGQVICIISDITASKRMKEALQFAYAELERIFNATAEGMCVVDMDFNVLRVNDALATLSGASKQDSAGRKCYEYFPGSLCHTPRCALRRLMAGEDYVEGEVEKERRDGTKLSCVLTAAPLWGPDDRLVGMVESLRDITELRKTQEQLQHSQLLASLGEMTAGIAHEVNNPLGSILLYSELLMAGDTPPQTKKDLKVIHEEAKRAARIMSDLLVYCRRGKSQMRRLDLHRTLKKLISMRQYPERVHNIDVQANLTEGPLHVKGDSTQLSQLFMNIMLNAEEALRQRGGGHIIITTSRDGEWAKVSVADDGTGIPPENLKQIFYPFFTTKRVGEGTGLGLSTCYGIVTEHNGLIHAENNEMGGATFIVELPLAGADAQARPSEQEALSGG